MSEAPSVWWRRIGAACLLVGCALGCAERSAEAPALVSAHLKPEPPREVRPRTTEQVVFDSAGDRLTGALRLPGANTRVPAALIAHGSGPMGQDGIMPGQLGQPFGFDFASYRALAMALSGQGIATFRYDKRGSAASGLDPGTTVELALDATRALDVLLRHPRIDSDRVFVIGHSQGGQMVPWLLQNVPRLAGGILLAAPARPVSEVLRRQGAVLPKLLEQRGTPAFDAHRQGMLVVAASERIAALSVDDLRGSTLGVDNRIWHSWMLMSLGAPWLAKRAKRPLLVVWGTADTNVDRDDFETWQEALRGSQPPARFVAIEGMTHALNGIDPRSASGVSTTLATGLSEELAQFIETNRRREQPAPTRERQSPSTQDKPASR